MTAETEEVLARHVLERTVELCAVPAPPLDEQDRADVVRGWWHEDGLADVSQDQVGNLWATLRPGTGPGLVVAAHLDTVFDREVEHGARRVGDRLVGPGVGDDTVAVAALSALDRLLPPTLPGPVWLVATVGEEGLGNLRGVTAALRDPDRSVASLIALEGNYLGRVNNVGVGSHRIALSLTGPGGHAWEDADHPSVVHVGGRIIADLDAMPRPEGRTTVNVGTVTGGESINARARHLRLQLDLRAESQDALDALVASADHVVRSLCAKHEVAAEVEVIGRRPAGSIDPAHRLVTAAERALESAGVHPRRTAASTDANAAYALGIPAVTLGITTGELTHTEEEWIDVDPIGRGLRALAETIVTYTTTEE
ncbi:M20/M25/M40 family metallo-hydrolase [Nocardioides caldifontis]|uniref:M20/M25/M40 family metallo-hydrolase n=1 Tax=Nocardioides caldifontis TaxID=2588938 RepID=UPI00193AB897|nr:M20/M25/M40 family metallo-hydrolase [Nocardioides caldifontis]